MIVFTNRGLIDLDTIRLMGVSVKETATPFGHFGTGLKYALSVLLREGCSVELWRDGDRIEFDTVERDIRGQSFRIVRIGGEELGFTTQHGRNWQVWQAYRELYCNARDEPEGRALRIEDDPDLDLPPGQEVRLPGLTTFIVRGAPIEEAHRTRAQTILQTDPLWTLPGVEVHGGESEFVFYQGIRVLKLQRKSRYTYNLTSSQTLTEDRTLAHGWTVPALLGRALVQSTSPVLIESVLTSGESWQEGSLPYREIRDQLPSQQFVDMAERLRIDKRLDGSGRNLFVAYAESIDRYGYTDPRIVDPTPTEMVIFGEARAMVEARGVSTEGLAFVFYNGLDEVSGFRGVVKMPAVRLSEGVPAIASDIIFAVAQSRRAGSGRGLTDQLVHMVLHGTWIPEPEDDETTRPRWSAPADSDEMVF